MNGIERTLLLLASVPLLAGAGAAQCRSWSEDYALPGVDVIPGTFSPGGVMAFETWDDGNGPALYLAGRFRAAGPSLASAVARWDGTTWSALGEGIDPGVNTPQSPEVYDMLVFDDGGGEALYVAGLLNSHARDVQRWDGTSWSAVGHFTSGHVNALEAFDDGNGPVLYAGGRFGISNQFNDLRWWDGSSWQLVPGWMSTNTSSVNDLQSFDDGSGQALYVVGLFSKQNGSPGDGLARFDGTTWSELPTPPALGSNLTLGIHDDGTGEALYLAVSDEVLRWDGAAWSAVGGPVGYFVDELHTHTDGLLYAAGATSGIPAQQHVSVWNGTSWVQVGSGTDEDAVALGSFDDGSGSRLFVGGAFTSAGGERATGIAVWSGADWESVHPTGQGSQSDVNAVAEFDDGSGPRIYAEIDVGEGPRVMRREDADWGHVGDVPDGKVDVLYVHDDGGGPALYAGGDFVSFGATAVNHVARWDGTAWQPLGLGVDSGVRGMTTWDPGTGTVLVIGGSFKNAGGLPAQRIAMWDGSSWSSFPSGPMGSVLDLAVYDDGTGNRLFAAGGFTTAAGNPVNNITRWNGVTWAPLLGGTLKAVRALEVFDDGSGEALYAGGDFIQVNNVLMDYIARWDGVQWSAVGDPDTLGSFIQDLAVFDDGTGPALWTSSLHRWNGSDWATPTGSANYAVRDIAIHAPQDGTGTTLFAGGNFYTPDGELSSSRIASWESECGCVTSYCTAGTSASGCQALLQASGVPSASAGSGFTLSAANTEGSKFGLFFFGTAGRIASPWGSTSSFKCVALPSFRGALITSSGTPGLCDGVFSDDLNARWAAKPNQNPGAGAVVQAQLWYRDPSGAGNPKTAFSDALELVVCP